MENDNEKIMKFIKEKNIEKLKQQALLCSVLLAINFIFACTQSEKIILGICIVLGSNFLTIFVYLMIIISTEEQRNTENN